MKKNPNNINSGKLLENYFNKNNIVKADLAGSINRNRVSIGQFIRKDTIQTSLLIEICYALKHNFFQDIANALPADFTKNVVVSEEQLAAEQQQKELIERLQEENKVLKIQNEVLREMRQA